MKRLPHAVFALALGGCLTCATPVVKAGTPVVTTGYRAAAAPVTLVGHRHGYGGSCRPYGYGYGYRPSYGYRPNYYGYRTYYRPRYTPRVYGYPYGYGYRNPGYRRGYGYGRPGFYFGLYR